MSEWWTYRLSDFLMFSPATYWRLVERYNREVWPLQLVMVAVGVCLLWLVATRGAMQMRVVPAVLAAVWAWVGWAFHAERYAQINWAAEYFAWAFWAQAAMLLAFAATGSDDEGSGRPKAGVTAMVLGAIGVLLYPLVAAMTAGGWAHAEVFGVMPDPTALATLGLVLAMRRPHRVWLAIIPVLWLVVAAATLWLLMQ
jgi:hypothetical protein